ncbi:MAG TPA: LacI family DNA-binding transcriptional regulator [Ohtaekwangia sp.]
MKHKKISISDIARKLDVSPTTVSFVLNGKSKEKRVSDEVVKKIRKYVEKVGYKPNTFARGLRTGKSKIIGLMIEDISNPFFASVAKLIEDRAYEDGYKIMYCSTHNDEKKARDLIKMFKDCRVDGYIIAPADGMEDEIKKLLKEKEKVVLFDRYFKNIPADYIVVDNDKSSDRAVSHLADQGFSNIAFITTASPQSQMKDRLSGYNKAIKRNKLKPLVMKIRYTEDHDLIDREIENFLRENPQVDAILFATNYLAVNGLEMIRKLGHRVPDDIGVIAFDDHILFQLYDPPITSITQPIEQIAEGVINALMEKLSDKKSVQKQVEIPTSLTLRKSSQRK